MNHKILDKNSKEEVTRLFTSVFTASEGEKEGRLIGNLTSELSSGTDNQEIVCFGTYDVNLHLKMTRVLHLKMTRPSWPDYGLG